MNRTAPHETATDGTATDGTGTEGAGAGSVAGDLSHVRTDGSAHMVDVTDKAVTSREATARAVLRTRPDVIDRLAGGDPPKGEALAAAGTGWRSPPGCAPGASPASRWRPSPPRASPR